MKRFFIFLVCLLCPALALPQSLPTKEAIMASVTLANDYWIRSHPDPGNNQWARATYFTGNLDLYKAYPEKTYLQYTDQWAIQNGWSLNGGVSTRNADNQCVGQVYIDLYVLDEIKDPGKISQINESIYAMVYTAKSDDWWWIDALYMAMPVFTRFGVMYSDTAYLEKMYRLYRNTKVERGLYNPLTGLWYRDESFDPPYKTPNGKDCYWSRGNGWVFAAHARVLQLLPETGRHRQEYLETFQNMAQALMLRQRTDGFWNVSLDDPDDYGGPETSGTSFFAYGMAWGINNGLLDSATYLPVVAKAWNGLVSAALHEDGYLGFIQGVGSYPGSSQPVTYETTSDFGLGAFLLAGSEVVKLAPGEMPWPTLFYMDSLRVIDENSIQVFFSDSVDEVSGTEAVNYSIDSVDILGVNLSEDRRSIFLTITPLNPGIHSLTVHDIKSATGHPVENGSTLRFLYNGNIMITASSYEAGTGNTPERSMDYDFNTRWSAEGTGEWILYDLGREKIVTSVDIAFYRGTIRKAYFDISLSSDGVTFTEVYNGESSGTTLELQNFDFDDRPARFVRITGYGNSINLWNSLTEVRINTRDATSTGKDTSRPGEDFSLYPNPFDNEVLFIKTGLEAGIPCRVQVLNLAGQMIAEEEFIVPHGGELRLKRLELPAGVYGVSVVNPERTKAGLLFVR